MTVPAGDPPGLERFAYAEVERLARRTCAAIPRGVLARSLDAVSSDRDIPRERPFSDNDIALLYAEDVRIQRIRLQQAAYDGCSAGLRDQRR